MTQSWGWGLDINVAYELFTSATNLGEGGEGESWVVAGIGMGIKGAQEES